MSDRAIVRVCDLTVRYGGLVALDGAAFSVPEGSICALVGRNGAGKSTCLRVLAGLLPPDAGTIEVLGASPFESTFPKRDVGFLLDDQALFSYLTATETLLLIASMYGVPEAERAKRCADLLAFFDLDRNPTQLVDEYSTGMTRRLALAAALIHAPKLLVLDEPFETLDPLMVNRLKTLLTQFVRDGRSVLLSTHLIDVAEQISDRVVILERGKVIVAGTVEDVTNRGTPSNQRSLEQAYVAAVDSGPSQEPRWLWSSSSRAP